MTVALVGMACRYPDADSPAELWRNVLSRRRAFRRIPPERLSADDYVASDPAIPDRTYCGTAATIRDWEFDRVRFRIAGSTFRSTDLAQWLALDVAAAALADAGWADAKGLPRARTAVLLGNTLTGEFSRARLLRLRWPYVRRVLAAALDEEGWSTEATHRFLARVETSFKAPFAPIDEDALAGGLSNTIAGRICNVFDLGGGGYTVDGACAASLLAVINACGALEAGDVDVAIAGGVDLSLDPFELVGFAKVGALAPRMMRVYDARSEGFWPGEGSGFVVLQRLEDARAREARVYATIQGWGISSDGSGGITRPEVEGQLRALEQAYSRAPFGIADVDVFEGHGTGTEVGDWTELTALTQARRAAGASEPAALGTIKANIGHTKAAAGVAGLIKATMSVHDRLIPPTTGCDEPHELLREPDAAVRVLDTGEAWPHAGPGRAGVSAMGFGGINTHVVVEGPPGEPRVSAEQRLLLASSQDAELLLLGASDARGLRERLDRVRAVADELSMAELRDLSATLRNELPPWREGARAAIVASTPRELAAALDELADEVGAREPIVDAERGLFAGFGDAVARVGLLFPGQASPTYVGAGALGRRFPFLNDVAPVDPAWRRADLVDTAVAQPAIVGSSIVAIELLRRLDVSATVALGHSLGELTALHWAGCMDVPTLRRLAAERGRAMSELGERDGAMASVAAPAATVERLAAGVPGVVVAGFNGPHATTVAGAAEAVEGLVAAARRAGLSAMRLPVSHAFHSPLVAAAADRLASVLKTIDLEPPRRAVVSTVTGAPIGPDADLRALLVDQVTTPVHFEQAVAVLAETADVLVEAGPGRVLTGLAGGVAGRPVVALDAGGPSLRPALHVTGALYALGAHVDVGRVFDDRFTRPFSLDSRGTFLANPCELAPRDDDGVPPAAPAEAAARDPRPNGEIADRSALEVVRALVAKRTELPGDALRDDSRLLGDLHLTSIAIGELAAEAARALELPPPRPPTELANATVAELAASIEAVGAGAPEAAPPAVPEGVAAWVRTFTVRTVEAGDRPAARIPHRWTVVAPDDHPLRDRLEAVFGAPLGGGDGDPAVVACIPPGHDERHAEVLLRTARAVEALGARRCAFVQHGGGAAGFAKSLHLELPDLDTCVVDIPAGGESLEDARAEAESARGFREIQLGADGARLVPVMSPIDPHPGPALLGNDDVVLVSGGGKGIGAECALTLAQRTGARIALLGTARAETDAELGENLRRFEHAGISHHYVRADVTDASAVNAAFDEVRQELGEVTAIVHGAGLNVPTRIVDLDEDALARTLAVKIRGARNLVAAADTRRLRLVVTFGSIIGRIGLRGESHYALANDWLASFASELSEELPDCRCLNVEWSVWSGAGMAERLGTVAALSQQGITPIPLDEGVRALDRLIRCESLPPSVVVAGRFGAPGTVRLKGDELPLGRFLERPRVHYPGIELVVDCELSRGTDPYLDDHVLDGAALFPAVMGLEAMAAAAQAVTGRDSVPELADVELTRPITVPAEGKRVIRVAALADPDGKVSVALRSDETDFGVDHFRAICRFGHGAAPPTPRPIAAGELIALEPARDLYGGVLFHGPSFQRLRGYRELTAHSCTAQVEAADAPWFAPVLRSRLVLGDPGARDAAIHCVQACIPHERLVPVGVRRLVPGRPSPGPLVVHAREREREGASYVYDIVVNTPDGTLVETWEGLALRSVGPVAGRKAWPAALLAPYLERRVADLIAGAEVNVAVTPRRASPGRTSDGAIERATGGYTPTRRPVDGKPFVDRLLDVSAAHVDGYTLAVSGSGPLACDAEVAAGRAEDVWRSLLGGDRLALARRIATEAGEELDAAATRVWAVLECVKKAGLPVDEPLTLAARGPEGWVVVNGGHHAVATCVTQIDTVDELVAVAVLAGRVR